jgi:hypothetical protein
MKGPPARGRSDLAGNAGVALAFPDEQRRSPAGFATELKGRES